MRISLIKKVSNFKKHPYFNKLLYFSSSNFIAIFLSILTQLLIPKILNVSDFGLYKTFTLYLGYTSLLHFGFKDGAYIYLCKYPNNLNNNRILFSFLNTQQLIITLLLLISLFFIKQEIYKYFIVFLSISSLISITYTYIESYYLARHEIKIISNLKILKTLTFLIPMLFVFFVLKKEFTFIQIISILLLSTLVPFLLILIVSRKEFHLIRFYKWNKLLIKSVYNRGLKNIIGNLTNQLTTNIDKIFVSSFFPSGIFGIYSFGGMFFILTNTLINSTATLFLPFLFKENKSNLAKNYHLVSRIFKLFSILFVPYFIIIFFTIKFFYPNYMHSIIILALMSPGIILNVPIILLHNNYLKLLNLEKLYIKFNVIAILAGLLFLFILYYLQIDYTYYSISLSSIILIKFLLNEFYLIKQLKLDKVSALLNFLVYLIITLIIVSIAYYIY